MGGKGKQEPQKKERKECRKEVHEEEIENGRRDLGMMWKLREEKKRALKEKLL